MLSILISWQLILIRARPTPWHHCLRWEKAHSNVLEGFLSPLSPPLSPHPSPTQLLLSMINPLRLPGRSTWYDTYLPAFQSLDLTFFTFWEVKRFPVAGSLGCCQFLFSMKRKGKPSLAVKWAQSSARTKTKILMNGQRDIAWNTDFSPQRPCELQILGWNKNSKINQMSLLAFSPHLWLEA